MSIPIDPAIIALVRDIGAPIVSIILLIRVEGKIDALIKTVEKFVPK